MRVDDFLGKGKLGEALISPTGMSTPPVNPAQQSAGATTPAVGTQPAANPQQQAQQAAMKLAKEKKAVQTLGQKLGPGVNQNKINTAMASTAKGQKPSPDSTAALAAIGQSAIDASTTNPQIADLIKRGVNTPMAEGNEVDEGTKAFGSTMMPFGGMPKIQENVTSTLTKRMQKINSKFTQSISENTDWPFQQVNELSNEKLGQYKKAAGADATAADKRGDFERGNKRFRGITTATKKQFANDIKKHYDSREQGVAEGSLEEVFEPTLNYYKLSNGKIVQASYRPNVNQSPVPFTDVSVSYVNPALKPQGPSFDSTGVAKPWTSAPDGVKQAIQKFVTQPQQGVVEGSEPEGSTFKNSLHTIIRVATHLEKQMGDSENFPEWESEMIGSVKDQMVKIMDYEISKKEQQGVAEATGDEPEECWTCRGTGEGQHEGQVCSNCHGSGVEPVEHDDDELWGSDYYESFDPKNESILTSLFR